MKLEKKIEYYKDGSIFFEHYIDENNRWQGEYKEYWSNGNLACIGFYKDDKCHGKWTWYKKDGSLIKIKYDWDGKEVSKSEFVLRSSLEKRD